MKKILLLCSLLSLVSCSNTEGKRGGVGEFCNGAADDCEVGLVCNPIGVCEDGLGGLTCDDACSRLADCGERENGCETDCRITIQDWRKSSKKAFVKCLTESFSCGEIQGGVAPQLCYESLPLVAEKEEICDRQCSHEDSFRKACYRLARVGSEDDFSTFKKCINTNCELCLPAKYQP